MVMRLPSMRRRARGGALALLDLRSFGVDGGGANTVASALSGTVTLVAVGQGRVAGSFDVMLAPYSASGFDTKNTTHPTGVFDAKACPGATQ